MLRKFVAALAVGVAIPILAGCGAGGGATVGGTPVRGGTAYFAQQPLSPPDYIFPLISGAYYSVENTADFQTLMYRPLYWYGDNNRPGVDYGQSLADAPLYSDRDQVVTVTLKHSRWSDGEPVSARDIGFWINLLKANREHWASYVPGGFPDNVRSWSATSQRTIRIVLNRSYNPVWFTDNELSQITPLPLAWDRTALTPHEHSPLRRGYPDATAVGARAVYRFLNSRAKDLSSYATSPIWSVVDGPWHLQQLTSSGRATFTPNRFYIGPDHPRIARFVELPCTSETAEFDLLRGGSASGGPGTAQGDQLSVGYVPDEDLPQSRALSEQGYRLTAAFQYGFNYFEPNFNNRAVGPILRQLYFRQALEHLVNQTGWIHAYFGGLGVPTYSPVPAQPQNPYANSRAHTNPYPYSISDAAALLKAHGWKVDPGGVSTCEAPGAGAGRCGAGIRAGEQLNFTLTYPTALSYTDGAMQNLQSDAAQAGIRIALKAVPISTIDAEIEPCKPNQSACSWELGQYGEPWVFAPDHYPTGEEIFQTGALGNVGSYSNPRVDRLIKATTTVPASRSQAALDAYADTVRKLLPDFWQPSPGTMFTAQGNLHGFTPNAYGFITPERWYFTR